MSVESDKTIRRRAIAVIPARGGSKRIPRKNIKLFGGKPVMAYPIEAAQKSDLFERILVSTDDEEIAVVAREWGADVPFMRPAELADDNASTDCVLLHAINWLAEHDECPSYVCCLYAATPFIRPDDIRLGYNLIQEKNAASVVAVTSYPASVYRALYVDMEGYLRFVWPENRMKRSQDFTNTWHDAGQFYWVHTPTFLKEGHIYSNRTAPLELPRWRVQDLDTPEDWITAEIMADTIRRRENQPGPDS